MLGSTSSRGAWRVWSGGVRGISHIYPSIHPCASHMLIICGYKPTERWNGPHLAALEEEVAEAVQGPVDPPAVAEEAGDEDAGARLAVGAEDEGGVGGVEVQPGLLF